MLEQTGTTEAVPKPTSARPNVAVATWGRRTEISSPAAMSAPLACRIRMTPNRVTSPSAMNLPQTIVHMYAI